MTSRCRFGASNEEISMTITSFRRSWSDATVWIASIVAAAALAACGGGDGSVPSTGAGLARAQNDPSNPIQIMSSEPSVVSGGNMLVRIVLPAGTAASAVKVLAAGNDMTSRFQEVSPGALLGVVDGLPVGM